MSLLSLPDELLWQCLPRCPFGKRDSIMPTCRRLADLLLRHEPGIHMYIPRIDMAGDPDEPDWRLALRKVLQLCPGVRYVVLGHHEEPLTDEELHKCFLGNMPAPAPGATWPQNPTAFLTHLTLRDITTAQLVPDVITTTCPKLKRLKLYWADIQPDADTATGSQSVACRPRLGPLAAAPAHLPTSPTSTLHNGTATDAAATNTITTTHAPPAGSSQCSRGRVQAAVTRLHSVCSIQRLTLHNATITLPSQDVTAQLRALTHLRHLDWCISYGDQRSGNKCHWDSVMQAVGQQLTQLRMTSWKTELDGPSMQWRVPKNLSPLVSLTDLRIAAVVTDSIMQQLLQQLPHVQQLHVDSFKVTKDYSSRQCSWQGVCMRHVIIATLPLLPLKNVTWLGYDVWWYWGSKVTLPVPVDKSAEAVAAAIAITQAAVRVAAACGGMKATGKELDDADRDDPHRASVHINLPQHYTEDQLLACLPLLQPLVGIEVMAPGLQPYGRESDDEQGCATTADPEQIQSPEISLALITALGKNLPRLKEVDFKACTFGRGVLTNITRVLPKVDKLRFYKQCFECMSEIVLLCGSLTRQVELWLSLANAKALDSDYERLVHNAYWVGGTCYNNVHFIGSDR